VNLLASFFASLREPIFGFPFTGDIGKPCQKY
jgi:hypothetical protein